MLEFAGNKYIYLPKIKKAKIKKIRKSEEENEGEAPVLNAPNPIAPMEEEKDDMSKKLEKYGQQNQKQDKDKNDKMSDSSDDAYLSVNFKDFNIDLENSRINPLNQSNQFAAPDINFKKAIDTNACVVRYRNLETPESSTSQLYQCSKCQAYLHRYSNITKNNGNDTYNWVCEFCSNLNSNIILEGNSFPKTEIYEKCLDADKKVNISNEDSSLIFCFDKSGSMCQSYYIEEKLKKKFNKLFNKSDKTHASLFDNYENVTDFSNFDFNKNNTNYISRLDLVKLSIENNIKSLLENSPNVKVGIVSFGSDIEVKGDCLSNVMMIKQKDMNNESKIISIGEENTNLIKSSIKQSSSSVIKSLREIEEEGATALGPAVLLSLSLLKNAKIGSRIFLCTDGMSNLGIGSLEENKEKAAEFYKRIGNMAKEKGIVISLITFEDSESEIYILKNMVELSGGEIIRVNPSQILEGFNDLLENNVIASDVEMKLNLNKCMTFRDEEKKDLLNDESTYNKKLGNTVRETETYHELKFKSSIKLAEFKDIDFDSLKYLIFQVVIKYKLASDGKRYIRVITQKLEISDDKEMVNKQAKMNIISNLQSRKSANLAGKGDLMAAQAQVHIARNFLNLNQNLNNNNRLVFHQFNRNMNSFHNNMNMMNSAPRNQFLFNNNNLFGQNKNNNNSGAGLFGNSNNNRGGLFGNNNMMMDNNMMNNKNMMNNNMVSNNMVSNNMMNNKNMMNNNMMSNNMVSNNMMNNNMMMMNNNMMNNNMISNNMMNNNMMNNNMMMNNNNMNNNSDMLSAQIFQIAHQSENQNNMNFKRSF